MYDLRTFILGEFGISCNGQDPESVFEETALASRIYQELQITISPPKEIRQEDEQLHAKRKTGLLGRRQTQADHQKNDSE